MEPRAVLVLYQPGHKLKTNKYLLSTGINIVGSDPKCQVHINSKQYFSQDYVANFFVTDDFMYIQALCDNMVQFKSNMQFQSSGRKKDVFRHIQKNCRYVLPMQQVFYIGPYKAIVQVQPANQLKKINNLLNLQNFQTPRGQQSQDQRNGRHQPQKMYRLSSVQNNNDQKSQSDKTQKIDSDNEFVFEPTLQISENDPYVYEPTLALDEEENYQILKKQFSQNNDSNAKNQNQNNKNISLSPRNNRIKSPAVSYSQDSSTNKNEKRKVEMSQISNISLFSGEKQIKKTGYSQQLLYETIKKQQNQLRRQINNQQDDFSMPDTIQDNVQQNDQMQGINQVQVDMPATIQQQVLIDEMPATIQQDENEMPGTIEQDQMPGTIQQNDIQQSQKIKKVNKTMYQKKQLVHESNINKHLYKSQKIAKQTNQFEEIDDIFNLFGTSDIKKVDSNQIQIEEKKQKQIKKKPLFNYQVSTFRNQKVLPHVDIQQFNSTHNNLVKSHASSVNAQKQQRNIPLNSSIDKKNLSPLAQDTSSGIVRKRLFKQNQKLKLVNITGFKPKPQDKITLRKRGFQIVSDSRLEDYDILIIAKNQPANQKLLMAILLDKEIVNQEWLKQKDWEGKKDIIQGTIQGISWETINKQRGKKDVFKSSGVYYLSDSLQNYAKVFQTAGGIINKQLNKRKKTNLIINCQAIADREFYNQSKYCKNWKFYSHKLINQSILIGQAQFKKYTVDDTSF